MSSEPYLAHHNQNKKDVLDGTGQWLIRDTFFEKWKRDSILSLFWLHGASGSGKSKLVSLVIEGHMVGRHQSLGTAFFYCSRDTQEPNRSEPVSILSSLARQLSSLRPGNPILPPSLLIYEQMKTNGFAAGSLSIEESTELIIDLTAYYSVTTIIIDALDECKFDSRHLLPDALQDILSQSKGFVKVFASSREEGDLVCELSGYPSIKVSSEKNSRDIDAFVRTETQKLVTKGRLLRHSDQKDEIQALIVKRLIDDAGGM